MEGGMGVNITAFGRKLALFQRLPAFHLKCPVFLRISSWKKCALCALLSVKWNSEEIGNQLPVLGKANSLCNVFCLFVRAA